MDGAVYEWDTSSGKRTGEYVLKNCSYTSISISPDARNIFAVGSDRKIKEISDSTVSIMFLFASIILKFNSPKKKKCFFNANFEVNIYS